MIRVGVLGATGMVGQHYVALLQDHPWFKITLLAASERSIGKPYAEAIGEWLPEKPLGLNLKVGAPTYEAITSRCDLVFSCMGGGEDLEEVLAKAGISVLTHNAAHRKNPEVPLVIPEINAHCLGEATLIAKPNCSIQSYVLPLAPLRRFGIEKVVVTTLQSMSGAGKGAMNGDRVIPYIEGEEEKSTTEPQRILERHFALSATCTRVPIPYGHYASVSVGFKQPPTRHEILEAWETFPGLDLPTAPIQPIQYCQTPDLDVNLAGGMAVSVERLRPCAVLDWQFVGLSHNVIRGAAGGGLLTAEALIQQRNPASGKSTLLRST